MKEMIATLIDSGLNYNITKNKNYCLIIVEQLGNSKNTTEFHFRDVNGDGVLSLINIIPVIKS